MSTQIQKRISGGVLKRACVMAVVLGIIARVGLAQMPLKPTDDPCATRKKYLDAQSYVAATNGFYKGMREPDWDNLMIPPFLRVKYRPEADEVAVPYREQRLKEFLTELNTTLSDYKKDTAGLTLKTAQQNAAAADQRHRDIEKLWQKKQYDIIAARGVVKQLQSELTAKGEVPTDTQKAQKIKEYEKTLKSKENEIKAILGLEDDKSEWVMDTAHYEIDNKNHRDFRTPEVAQKKKALDAVLKSETSNAADIKNAEIALNAAIENARKQAKTLLNSYDATEKQMKALGSDEVHENNLEKTQKAQELQQAQAKLKALEAQRPTDEDVTRASEAAQKAGGKVIELKQIRTLEALRPQVQPWINARMERNEASKELKIAQDEYRVALESEKETLANAKARLQDEQERMGRVQASLQGKPKDEVYYQKLSQMTLHARATYELIMMSVSDFDCYTDTRNFMDSLRVRMAKLDVARDKILQQASTVTKPKPKPPVVIVKKPPVKKPTVTSSDKPLWICDGPVIEKSTRFRTSLTSSTFDFRYSEADEMGHGTIKWSGVPMSVHEGDTITLTMSATGTGSASAGGWFNFNCAGSEKRIAGPDWDNNCASVPGNDRGSPTPNARMVFKFVPDWNETYIQVVVGMNEGYTNSVIWKYHKK